MKTIMVLPDGRQISSGVTGDNAIMALELTQSVNAGQELTLGSCCSSMAQITVLDKDLNLQGGERLELLRADGTKIGSFYAARPSKKGGITTVTAYDGVSLLDKELPQLLGSLTWPCSLYDLAVQTCRACGLELSNTELPNGQLQIQSFTASGVTGRQLMQWIGQVCGCFCRAVGDSIELSWYTPRQLALTSKDYYRNSLTMAGYRAAPIEKVQLHQSYTDVGVVWPNVTGEKNTYVIRGNPLLSTQVTAYTEPVAQALYEKLCQVSYTPCTVTVPQTVEVFAGDIIHVDGQTVYVMTTRLHQGQKTLECTGSPTRQDTQAINSLTQKDLNGRVLELDTRVEGLKAENRDSAGKLAKLSLTVDGISAAVSTESSNVDKRLTSLEQTADSLRLRVEQGVDQVRTATGYTFGTDGLRIARTGTEMENRLDHTGMYVERSGEVILKANNRGVLATDVQVRNYLTVGSHARLEDYADRTACFYLEGGSL